MKAIPTLVGAPREWAQDLAIATLIGVFLGVIGPFGSFYGGPIELRIAYWVANLWIGFTVFAMVTRLSLHAAVRLDVPIWFALAIGVAIGSVPAGLSIAWFSSWFWPGNHGHMSSPFAWYGQTLAIAEPCAFGYYFLADRGWRKAVDFAAAPEASANANKTSFLDRLPTRLGRSLLCLQMEDHYVRAHTAVGSDLILISLRQAIAELDGVEGIQVHRSWWVARSAVAASRVDVRNYVLQLSNGLDVPVSRASVAKLRAAGWLSS